MPFSTATPNNAMNPTPADMLNGSSRSQRATIPPMSDSGTVENTMSVYVIFLKAKNKISRMSINATGMTISSVLMAFCKFSNWPPYSK